jgi:hypothetical protein
MGKININVTFFLGYKLSAVNYRQQLSEGGGGAGPSDEKKKLEKREKEKVLSEASLRSVCVRVSRAF